MAKWPYLSLSPKRKRAKVNSMLGQRHARVNILTTAVFAAFRDGSFYEQHVKHHMK